MRTAGRGVALVSIAALLVGGCSEDAAPGESVPALATSLDEVDAAVEDGDFKKARQEVQDLITQTAQARVEGDITDEQADRIFEAARDVLDELRAAEEEQG